MGKRVKSPSHSTFLIPPWWINPFFAGMCGIVGYMGNRDANPILIKGLKRLEYRGYDSAGIALQNGTLRVIKRFGKVKALQAALAREAPWPATSGIGHTRWATHGAPNDINAHPHYSNSGKLVIVHNGIIENFDVLRQALTQRGFVFKSQTDTEVLVNLIEHFQQRDALSLKEATRLALHEVVGAYAIALMEQGNPDEIIVARMGSPLAIGLGRDEYFIASDASPFVEYTKEVIYLEDGELAVVKRGEAVEMRKIQSNDVVSPSVQALELNLEQIEKDGYAHFMLKEIYEQPRSIRDTLRGRLLVDQGIIKMAGIWDHKQRFVHADRLLILGCGTSWHAGLIGEYLFESLARVPVEVEYASEFRYRNPIVTDRDVVIAISQSGETADTLAALELAKERGAFTFGICNVVGSSIARMTHAGAYTHAGPEIGVASTKAFTAQIAVLILLALKIGKHRAAISKTRYMTLCRELQTLPEKVERALRSDTLIKTLSHRYKDAKNALYLGRGYNFPIALEGALKLKEISYIHAEGYPAAEMKHGPIALVDEQMPVIVIATKKGHYDKIVSNIQELKARSAKLIAVVSQGDTSIEKIVDHVIAVPETTEALSPLLTVIPLQLLSYHIAALRGVDVDRPRNLAKSVTVE